MSRILVTGSKSGIGADLAGRMEMDGHTVYGYDLPEHDVRDPDAMLEEVELDILVNCAGTNHLDWLEDFKPSDWDRIMDVNAKGIYLMSRLFLPTLKRNRGTILNILSNASHKPMNASIAYNASKGAAHIMTLQMARELTKRHNITVFGIAPAHIADTGMSRMVEKDVERVRGWTAEMNREYLRQNSVTGNNIPLDTLTEFIAFLLSSKERHRHLSGCILPYGA